MENPIQSAERAGSINGVDGRFFARTIGGKNYKPGTFTSQRWGASREFKQHGARLRMAVNIRFDDNCRNGHNTFAITCDIDEMRGGAWREYGGGAAHDEIARVFPELAPLIKWHLFDQTGPMHYVANTVYHASNRDHRGALSGEPCAWETVIQFGRNPIKHKPKAGFVKFLQAAAPHPGRDRFEFEVLAIEHESRGKAGEYQFGPKYTFGGYGSRWHECPFDTEADALDFLAALQTCEPEFVKIASAWGEGKERNLDHARSTAVWPEATDEELCADKATLTAALVARLPALIAAFRADIEAAGFFWAPTENVEG